MAVLSNTGIRAGASGVAAADDTHRIKRSARFTSGDSSYLNWTPAAAGNRKKWAFSCWVKRTQVDTAHILFETQDAQAGTPRASLVINENNILRFAANSGGSSWDVAVSSNNLLRDVGAWYHIHLQVGTGNATAANRVKLYINGVEVSYNETTYPTQNLDLPINQALGHRIGAGSGNSLYLNGYMSDIFFIDGFNNEPSSHTETDSTTGQLVPKEYNDSYGTNGFHLAMDPANGGTNWSIGAEKPYNTDHTSYPISLAFNGSLSTYAMTANSNGDDANLVVNLPGLAASKTVRFYGYKNTNAGTLTFNGGAVNLPSGNSSNKAWVTAANQTNGSSDSFSMNVNAGSSISDDLGVYAVEVDGKILVDHTVIGYDSSGNDNHWHENNLFGSEQLIANGNFKAVQYTGNGGTQTINCGFQPDFVWLKSSSNAYSHSLYDSVRGVTQRIQANDNAAEGAVATGLTAFTSTGFTIGSDIGINGNGNTQIAWCWKAGGAASSNSDGSGTSSVSANPDAGFSIVKYTGTGASATWGHGLGKEPEFIMIKDLDGTNDWNVYHKDVGYSKAMKLNDNSIPATPGAARISATSSTTFTTGSAAGECNASGTEYIAYCWAPIDGYSKFSSFKDPGAMRIELGFWPGLWINKRTDAANAIGDGWGMFDKHRSKFDNALWAQDAGTGGTGWANAENPNGFTWGTGSYSDGDYISMAWAGDPAEQLDLLADVPGAPYDNELNGGGNYATLNPLDNYNVLSSGNLDVLGNSGAWRGTRGTFGMSSGKWYFEVEPITTSDGNNQCLIGIAAPEGNISSDYVSVGAYGWEMYSVNGNKYNSGNQGSYGSGYTEGDVIGIAFDADGGSLTFYKNGVSQGVAFTGLTSGPYFASTSIYGTMKLSTNFGQRAFAYTPPAGYKALNTYNLSDPTITDPSTAFGAKAYTGNGSTTSIDYGFEPDLVWIKSRSNTYYHRVFDAVRGANKEIYPNDTAVEATGSGNSFDSDGFNVASNYANNSGVTFISWAWDAGTANVSKSAGDLNSTAYDQSQTWSNAITGTLYSGQAATTAFNGENTGIHAATNNTLTFTTPGGVTLSGTVEVHMSRGTGASSPSGDYDVKINGTSVFNHSTMPYNTNGWVNLGSHTLSTLAWGYKTGNDWIQMNRIKVGGKELVDNGVSVDNVPSIATTYRVNPNTGFSVVSYTGVGNTVSSVAHGLNTKPDLIIVKDTDAANDWAVYHSAIGETKDLCLNTQDAASTRLMWNNTSPTSNVFTIGAGANSDYRNRVNDTNEYIAHCWSEVAGYSKFGSYAGNNDSDGPFVWCGFKPKWLLIKGDVAGEDWCIIDTEKESYNDGTTIIQFANGSDTEYTNSVYATDILSNGFKLRNNNPRFNTSNTYIFAAFAESPFKYANAH